MEEVEWLEGGLMEGGLMEGMERRLLEVSEVSLAGTEKVVVVVTAGMEMIIFEACEHVRIN